MVSGVQKMNINIMKRTIYGRLQRAGYVVRMSEEIIAKTILSREADRVRGRENTLAASGGRIPQISKRSEKPEEHRPRPTKKLTRINLKHQQGMVGNVNN